MATPTAPFTAPVLPPPPHRGRQAIIWLLLGGLLVFVGSYVGLTARYWSAIRAGRGAEIAADLNRRFTTLPGRGAVATNRVERALVETTDDPYLGAENAAITIVEFVDFKCPNCKAAAPILKQLLSRRGRDLKLIIRDFPIESIHPGATRLAEAASCAHRLGRFWPVHDALYASQDTLGSPPGDAEISALLSGAGLPVANPRLTECLEGSAAQLEVRQDLSDGLKAGVRGTPTWFVNGEKVEGVVPLEWWLKYLEKVGKQ